MGVLRDMNGRLLLAMLVAGLLALAPGTAMAQAPGVDGYGGVASEVVEETAPPEVLGDSPDDPVVPDEPDEPEEEAEDEPEEEAEVAGTSAEDPGQGAAAPATVTRAESGAVSGGTLPFTGLQIGLILLVGLAMVALGLTLRRASAARELPGI